MTTTTAPPSDLIARIRGEFLEMPGLKLTVAQAQRLWGLDHATCQALLDVLVQHRFLARTRDGSFVRTDRPH
jgi:DNA-binding IclR family transcriptional regulator